MFRRAFLQPSVPTCGRSLVWRSISRAQIERLFSRLFSRRSFSHLTQDWRRPLWRQLTFSRDLRLLCTPYLSLHHQRHLTNRCKATNRSLFESLGKSGEIHPYRSSTVGLVNNSPSVRNPCRYPRVCSVTVSKPHLPLDCIE